MARFLRTVGLATAAALLLGSGLFVPPAQAGYVVTLTEQNGNVVATGSGPIDLTGLSHAAPPGVSLFAQSQILPDAGVIVTGPASSTLIDPYLGLIGPASFGSGINTIFASSGSGDLVGISGLDGALTVPGGYVSGNPLSDTSTYAGQTFASLGVTPGTYEWTWGTGANQNITLTTSAVAVPEPSSFVLLGGGLFAMWLARRRLKAA
jgi:hypothetical protein